VGFKFWFLETWGLSSMERWIEIDSYRIVRTINKRLSMNEWMSQSLSLDGGVYYFDIE